MSHSLWYFKTNSFIGGLSFDPFSTYSTKCILKRRVSLRSCMHYMQCCVKDRCTHTHTHARTHARTHTRTPGRSGCEHTHSPRDSNCYTADSQCTNARIVHVNPLSCDRLIHHHNYALTVDPRCSNGEGLRFVPRFASAPTRAPMCV